jgi:septal ring-binding cell division protein DamX
MIQIHKMCLLLCLTCGFAQMAWTQDVQLNEDPKVTQVMNSWISGNRSNPRIEGWRVQIMASTDRNQVEQARNRFRTEYPEVAATSVQEQPYYKLRVGAFRNKQQALAFIAELTGWPGAYPARDVNIHPRDFLEQ